MTAATTTIKTLANNPHCRRLAWLAIVLMLLAAPFLIETTLGRSWVRIADVALLFIMLALGLNIVVGFAGLLDLGYIAFFAVGAYSYALLASPQLGVHWPFLVLLPLGAAVAALFGILLGGPTLRLREGAPASGRGSRSTHAAAPTASHPPTPRAAPPRKGQT